MALITRDQIKVLPWRSTTVAVEALDGEVEVRPMPLDLRLEAGAYAGGNRPADFSLRVLAATVFAGDGKPVYDADGWARFNSQHPDAVLSLIGEVTMITSRAAEGAEGN